MATKPVPPTALRALYRALLRELPPRMGLSDRTPLYRTLRAQFSSSPRDTTTTTAAAIPSARHALQYAAYFKAQRTYAALLERYNPGMGMDEEERVRLTARRVGMDLPVEFSGEK
ncbi:hypothetical protein GGTG_07532 [Gaeumannomyces tritici R3-111a-1]|uniref:FMC1 protein family n=1 Tax=Gaeumannomyces tritici (strain R3-111a-1) TaxID=644352 RepID=J3P1Y4_GAET3|nr:hypothetical protein GGTG_07532 [Gaeumannomyces tritici R3-111a-1]EJT73676.1 hypothetical protein GGTG_07532 [Gaeumannomyces tritici R3-111a-1]